MQHRHSPMLHVVDMHMDSTRSKHIQLHKCMDGYHRLRSIDMERTDNSDIWEDHRLVSYHLLVHPDLHLRRLQRTDKSVVHNLDMAVLATLLHMHLQSIDRCMENVDILHSTHMGTAHSEGTYRILRNRHHHRHSPQVHLRCLQRYQDYFLILPVVHSVSAKSLEVPVMELPGEIPVKLFGLAPAS